MIVIGHCERIPENAALLNRLMTLQYGLLALNTFAGRWYNYKLLIFIISPTFYFQIFIRENSAEEKKKDRTREEIFGVRSHSCCSCITKACIACLKYR